MRRASSGARRDRVCRPRHALGGQAEPVREIPFYALRSSLAEIHREAERSNPPATLDQFIDGSEGSAELKAWMKKHHTVDFAGTDFTKQLTADDVIGVPEFLAAYKLQNGSALKAAVPEPKKLKPAEQQQHPEKLAHETEQYQLALHRFIAANPESLQGLDAEFIDKNPVHAWVRMQAEQQRHLARRTLELAQSQYLAGQARTDTSGHGAIAGLAPGTYWLTALDTPAMAGDVRLNWDVAVTVRAAETARVELSNLYALDTDRTAP